MDRFPTHSEMRWASATRWCGCRSASRTLKTCGAICATRWMRLPHAERRRVRPSEHDAARDRLHGPDEDLASPLVVARVDEFDGTLHHLQKGRVTRCTDLQRAELRQPVDRACRIDRCHCHDLLQ